MVNFYVESKIVFFWRTLKKNILILSFVKKQSAILKFFRSDLMCSGQKIEVIDFKKVIALVFSIGILLLNKFFLPFSLFFLLLNGDLLSSEVDNFTRRSEFLKDSTEK